MNILVADDISINKMLLENFLIAAGHNVTLVSDGTEVIDEFRKRNIDNSGLEPFDAIITDVTMNKMNGDIAAAKVRKLEEELLNGKRILIVATTGHVFEEELEKIKKAGIDYILPKPITEDELLSLLDSSFCKTN